MSSTYAPVDLADIPGKTFIGFRQNIKTGQTYIDVIGDGSTVVLPDPINTATGYRNYFWTQTSMTFSMTGNGHLQVSLI